MPVEGRGLTSGMWWKGPRIRRVAMLPRTSIHDSAVPEGTRGSAKDGQACRFVGRPPNPVGEPDAANPHVRFDEGEVETESWGDTRAPATERAGHTQGFPTLPRHLSTLPGLAPDSASRTTATKTVAAVAVTRVRCRPSQRRALTVPRCGQGLNGP